MWSRGENGEPDLLYIDLQLLHEVTSPQAFDGLRQEEVAPPRPDDRDRGPQHPHDRHRQADRGHHLAHPDRHPAPQCRGIRCAHPLPRRQGAGDRARRRPTVGADHAGNHRGVRRLPHLDPRRLRRARLRYRHQRGRARAGHPDPPADPLQDDGGHRHRRAEARCHREGHHPRGDREDRHRRRRGLCARVPRRGDPRPLHGGADDDLQHVDRGRCPRRHDRPRRYLPSSTSRTAPTPRRARTGTRPSSTGRRCAPRTTPPSTPRWSSMRTRSSPSSPGAPTPARACRCPVGSPPRRTSPTTAPAMRPSAPWSTWTSFPAPR